MAKNLKLNVKNAQLAEALKLGNIKKPAIKKKKPAETTAPETAHVEEKKVAAPAPSVAPTSEPSAKPAKVAETKEPTTPKETPMPVSEKPQAPVHPRTPIPSSTPVEPPASAGTYSAPRTDGYTSRYQDQRAQQASAYPPKRQEGGYSSQGNQAGYPPRRPEGGGYPPRQEGGYPPRREGGYSSQGGSQGGYPPRREGGYPSSQGGQSGQNYPARQQGSYPPRQEGGYPPRREGYSPQGGAPQGGGYPPRQQGGYPPRQEGGYPPRREGGYSPQSGQGGYPPRQQGAYPPRQGYSSEGSAGQTGYRPGGAGAPPFRRPPGAGYTPGARPPYPPRPRPFQPGGAPGGGGYSDARRPFTPRGPVLPEEAKGDRKVRSFADEPRKAPHKEFREHKQPAKRSETGSFDARDRQGLRSNSEDQGWRKRRPAHKMRPLQQEEIIRPKTLAVKLPITIKDLAFEMKLKASQLIAKLFMKGVVLTLNDYLDDETTLQLLGHDFDCEITIDRMEENRLRITDKTIKEEIQEAPVENLILRAPVVAFMGHVDHGKTSLIDRIRKSDIAGDEAGAITQHIGAFKCHTAVGDITILDTPGHEAFSAMRARGADVTDIIVLVIAGDEGIRTQTIEAITQAQTAGVPILVALNKSDRPNFDPENVYRQLSEHNLLPEPWGGQTIVVNCSAVTGEGVKELLEMLALQAEVLELRANPHQRARGSVIESEMHKGMGAVATILVQNGTLRVGDSLVFSQQFARIKTMHNEHDKELTEAGPSTPVKITGLSALPEAGSEFIVVKNEKEAMEIAEKRTEGKQHTLLHQAKRGAESFLAEKATGIKKKILNLIIRGDVQGSVEALKNSLLKITSDKINLNIISSAVGEISESDVQLASASKATILGFHTKIESHAEGLIKALKVTIKLHDIIYHAVDEIRAIMLGMLDKVAKENDSGSAEIRAVFKSSHLGVIAGCMVLDGTIKRSAHVRQMRDNKVIWKGPLHSLKRAKDDAKEVSKGYECGIVLQNNNDVKVGDILQAFEITYLEQEL